MGQARARSRKERERRASIEGDRGCQASGTQGGWASIEGGGDALREVRIREQCMDGGGIEQRSGAGSEGASIGERGRIGGLRAGSGA